VGADHVSAEQQKQMDELIGDLNELYVADVARGRGRTPEEVQAIIDQGPYSARTALAAGLIDGLAYADEVRALLGRDSRGGPRRARLGPFSAVLASQAPPTPWRRLRDRRPAVAVLDVDGIITGGKSRSAPWMSATAGSDTLVSALTKLRLMPEVKAVVLRINSRGGSAAASDLIWRAAVRLNQEKPVIAYLDDVAASGGYYIAAAGRRIIAAPTCITGSIGVFMMRPNLAGLFEKLEVDRATVRRGARATIYRTDHALTDDERKALQEQVIETYDEFIQVVTEGRSLPEARVRELAEGRVYLATRAKQVGLVDEMGTLSDAIEAAAQAAQLKRSPRLIWWHAAPSGLMELLRLVRQRDSDDADARMEPLQALWLGEAPL
jgi:protease-4